MRLIGAAFALLIVLALPAVASAAPGSDATIQSVDFTVAEASNANATATCPSGRVAVGGGVQALDPANSVHRYRVQYSSPVDETGQTTQTATGDTPRGWTGWMSNIGGGSIQVRVYAICSATSDATLQVSEYLSSPAGFHSRSVPCPSGSRAIGGGMGVAATPDKDDYGSLSAPVDSSGTVAGTNDGDVPTAWLSGVYANTTSTYGYRWMAICSPTSDATVQVAQFDAPNSSDASGSAVAGCPSGQRALGGGIAFDDGTLTETSNPSSGNYRTMYSGPLDSGAGSASSTQTGDVGRAWYGEERFVGSGTSAAVRTLAVCTKDPVVVTPPPDKTPPQTTIVSGPKPTLKKGKSATFVFSSNEAGSRFECKLDGGAAAACTSPLTLKRPAVGRHVFSVTAIDKAGNRDATPATYSFKVKKKRRKHHKR